MVTNRAPCMTAWAYIICEKMGFDRLEALSLGECSSHPFGHYLMLFR